MSSSDSPRRFLAWFGGAFFAALAVLLLLTALVDPRGLVAQAFPGFPRPCTRGMIHDDRAAKRALPDLRNASEAFLGNSRVAAGFAAEDVREALPGQAINLAINAATLPEMADHLDRLLRRTEVRRVWVALDFGMFNKAEGGRETIAHLPPTLHALRYGVADFVAARHALRNLASSGCRAPRIGLGGFIESGRGGHPDAVSLDRAGLARSVPAMAARFRQALGDDGARRARDYRMNMALVGAMADAARRRGVTLVLYVPPSHPAFFEALGRAGSDDEYRMWQADLARRFGGRQGVVFRDFSGAGAALVGTGRCSTEGKDGCPFYDPVHFRTFVGALIIRSVLASSGLPKAAQDKGSSTSADWRDAQPTGEALGSRSRSPVD